MFRIVHKVGLPYSITLFGASPVLPFLFTLYCCSYGLTIFWEISLDIVTQNQMHFSRPMQNLHLKKSIYNLWIFFSRLRKSIYNLWILFRRPRKVSTICGYFLDAPGKISTRYSILIIAVLCSFFVLNSILWAVQFK